MHTNKYRFACYLAVLMSIVGLGMWLRLSFAPVTAHGDTNAFRSWMESSVKLGLVRSYEEQVNGNTWMPSYPPFSLFLLQVAGHAYQWTYSPDYIVNDPVHMVFAKGPAIVADVLISVVLFLLFLRWKRPKTGLFAAAIFAVNPAVFFNSALWGQMDSPYVLLILGTLTAFVWSRPSLATLLITLAFFTKPQTILFLPLFFFVVPLRLKTILSMLTAMVCTAGVVLAPFVLAGKLHVVWQTFDVMHVMNATRLSWNAYNFWWMLFGAKALDIPATDLLMFGITYRHMSLVLVGCAYLVVLYDLRKLLRGNLSDMRSGEALFLAAGTLSLAVFMLGTDMHERYLFPYLAFALPCALGSTRRFLLYICVSFLLYLNLGGVFMHGVFLTYFFEHAKNASILIAIFQMICLLLYSEECPEFRLKTEQKA